MYPTDRRYSKEHEWILVEDGVATVGITDFAQDQLGDIVYVELAEEGRQVEIVTEITPFSGPNSFNNTGFTPIILQLGEPCVKCFCP